VTTKDRRACPVCNTLFPDSSEWCPVCALRAALRNEAPGNDPIGEPTLSLSELQLDHYEIVTGEDGTNAQLLSQLAVVDALLSKKEAAIEEAKRAIEMLPISLDAVDGPGLVINLVVVYAWVGEPDLAFETLRPLTKVPGGIFYGQLKRETYWDPLRNDPRFEELLAELAPR
jgi:hypothetical protein